MSADSISSGSPIVVVGGGALGLSVAYFLGQAHLPTLLIAPPRSQWGSVFSGWSHD